MMSFYDIYDGEMKVKNGKRTYIYVYMEIEVERRLAIASLFDFYFE